MKCLLTYFVAFLIVAGAQAARAAVKARPEAGVNREGQRGGPEASPEAQRLAAGNNRFALDLYARLAAEAGGGEAGGNVFFSPYSLSTALGMAHAGAKGATAAEMAKTLHFDLKGEELDVAFAELIGSVNRPSVTGYKLSVANAMWGQSGYGFLPQYVQRLKQHYAAALHELNFQSDSQEARKTINAWAEKETAGKIRDLMPPDSVGPDTVLVLTNAIYFKGDWEKQFKKEHTRDGPFHVSADKTVTVPLMTQRARFRRLIGEGFQALEMPYAGGDLSMVVLLPDERNGLADLEQKMTAPNVEGWLKRLAQAPQNNVPVMLPKFTMTESFSLVPTLAKMGMAVAFDGRRADFSGMNGGTERLAITAVVHKAFVAVDEQGTEAAAATGVSIGRTSAEIEKPFRADHPFAFLIRDGKTGSVLFMGRVVDPSGK